MKKEENNKNLTSFANHLISQYGERGTECCIKKNSVGMFRSEMGVENVKVVKN